MEEVTFERRTISVDGNAKTNVRWFRHKYRLPRKKKKWVKLQYGPYWKARMFTFGWAKHSNSKI